MQYRVIQLDVAGWASFEALLGKNQSNSTITKTIVAQLKLLNAVSVLIEDDYIDRDFSEAYSAYYAKTFRRHSKLCIRALVFASDISFLATVADVKQAATQLANQDYIACIVLRPIQQAPIGQALIKAPPFDAPYEAHLLVKGNYAVHALGAELCVEGIPMTQQDSRVGACAQATIWVAARHFHSKRRGPWLSTVAITQSAIANQEFGISQVLPVGSEFLSVSNMVAALRSAGQEPLVYAATGFDSATKLPNWPNNLRPADIINRYVDSGIPVIVGLRFPNQDIGHAIIITGQIYKEVPVSTIAPKPTRAVYCEAYFANDDQIGPNVRVPVNPASTVGETPYNISENALYLIIPLPTKVYVPAEKAEAIAWGILNSYSSDWTNFKTDNAGKLGGSEHVGDKFITDLAANQVVARTYLTYGWKYKHRNIHNNFSNPVRQIIRNIDLPRFVYVTEFSSIDTISTKTKYERRVVAHVVIDATAKHSDIDSVSLFHAPGMCFWHSHDDTGKFIRSVAAIESSELYYPKIRGEMNFDSFQMSLS